MTDDEIQALIRVYRSQEDNPTRDTFLWGPENADPILAKDLTISHLCNIINWILDRPDQYGSADGTLAFMIAEAKYRRLPAFAANEPYIQFEALSYNSSNRARLVTP